MTRNVTPFVCGNWKMHKTLEESVALADALLSEAGSLGNVEIGIAPTYVSLHAVSKRLAGSKIRLAAQNMHFESQGAYTGEISAQMLKSVGCDYAIIGHSERRQLFSETNEGCAKKVVAALNQGLRVIYCIGETLAERDAGRHFDLVSDQLVQGIRGLEKSQTDDLVIAYEPVWAIGTGRTASPNQAQEMHAHLRSRLGEQFGADVAQKIRIQYGGSVKPDNARDLFGQADIDGGLIGGAALKPDSFLAIAKAAAAG